MRELALDAFAFGLQIAARGLQFGNRFFKFRDRDRSNFFNDLLPIEWVKTGAFLRVDADFKGFFVNLPVTG